MGGWERETGGGGSEGEERDRDRETERQTEKETVRDRQTERLVSIIHRNRLRLQFSIKRINKVSCILGIHAW